MSYILAVVVTYQKPTCAFNIVSELLKQCNVDLRVIVVDNSISSDSSTLLRSLLIGFKNIHIIISPKNLGYAQGNNLGVKEAIIKWGNPSFILFSNDDIRMDNQHTVSALVNTSVKYNISGCIQPRIRLRNGFLQGPYSKSNIYLESLCYFLPIFWVIVRNIRQRRLKSLSNISVCYRVMGAFFLIKYESFISVGLFDSNTFLYREEEILALKLYKIGVSNYYNPTVCVLHEQEIKTNKLDPHTDYSDLYFYKYIVKSNDFSILIFKFSKYLFRNIYQPLYSKLYKFYAYFNRR